MRSIVTAASAAFFVLGSAGALAQDVEVEINRGGPYYYDTNPAPRTQGYSYRSERPAVVVPIRPANCGEFRYWDGQRCVDARYVPPPVR
jgi:hypothetical protein